MQTDIRKAVHLNVQSFDYFELELSTLLNTERKEKFRYLPFLKFALTWLSIYQCATDCTAVFLVIELYFGNFYKFTSIIS